MASKKTKWVVPIRCENSRCPNYGTRVNEVSFPSEGAAYRFVEQFADSHDPSADTCPGCRRLGVAGDPEEAERRNPSKGAPAVCNYGLCTKKAVALWKKKSVCWQHAQELAFKDDPHGDAARGPWRATKPPKGFGTRGNPSHHSKSLGGGWKVVYERRSGAFSPRTWGSRIRAPGYFGSVINPQNQSRDVEGTTAKEFWADVERVLSQSVGAPSWHAKRRNPDRQTLMWPEAAQNILRSVIVDAHREVGHILEAAGGRKFKGTAKEREGYVSEFVEAISLAIMTIREYAPNLKYPPQSEVPRLIEGVVTETGPIVLRKSSSPKATDAQRVMLKQLLWHMGIGSANLGGPIMAAVGVGMDRWNRIDTVASWTAMILKGSLQQSHSERWAGLMGRR